MKVGIIGAAVMAAVIAAPRVDACECLLHGIDAWPPSGRTIPTNAILLLHGDLGSERDLVAYIDEHRPALSCGRRTIPLRLKDLFVGSPDVEALLVPAHRLPPLTRCAFVLTAQNSRSIEPVPWIDDDGPAGPPWWNTAASSDRRPPVWAGSPRWTGPPEREGICDGGWVSIQAAVQAADAEGPVIFRAVLDDGHEKNDFLLAPQDGAIEMGSYLCGGAFELEKGHRYRVSLSVIDAAGHETRAPAPLPPFTAP